MERRRVVALLVVAKSSRDPDLAAFVGPVHLGESILVAPRSGSPRLGISTGMEREEAASCGFSLLSVEGLAEAGREADGEATARASQWSWALRQSGVDPGSIALAGRYSAGVAAAAVRQLERDGWRLSPFERDLLRLRRRKTDWEIERIRRSAVGTVAAFRTVAEALAAARPQREGGLLTLGGEPLTAGRLRLRVARTLAAHGLEQPEGNIVSAGRDAAVPHTQGASERPLRAGECIVVDLYPKGRLFADCTRTFCLGTPSDRIETMHRSVREALEASSRSLEVGRSGRDLQEAVCDRFEAAGWETARGGAAAERGYVHGLGHGVGYELHELPAFRGEDDTAFEPGDVFTLEPGLYDPVAGVGVRLEDLFVMTESGAECLTPLPYDLDPRQW